MANVLFDRDSLRVVDTNREKLPYEVEVRDVETESLTKQVDYLVKVDKKDEEGNQLYLLPQLDIEVPVEITKTIETTEVTDRPIIITVKEKRPLLDSNGKQITYERTISGETTEVTDEPVMVFDEATGEQVQKTNEEGKKLYIGQVPTGEIVECTYIHTEELQKTNELDQKLYYSTVTEVVPGEFIYEPQEPLEILEDNYEWHDGLERAALHLTRTRTAKFEDEYSLFTYRDVVAHKELSMTEGTLYTAAALHEQMGGLFSTELSSFKADLGFDFISLPPHGEARTIKLPLPKVSAFVGVRVDSSNPVKVEVGRTASNLISVDRDSEVLLDSETEDVYVRFTNTSDKRVDIHSFALLV